MEKPQWLIFSPAIPTAFGNFCRKLFRKNI